jgi:hypothetical protein
MDYILDAADEHIFTPYVYSEDWAKDDMYRQFLSLFIIVNVGGALVYLIPGILNYYFVFDHNLMKHKKFLENQVFSCYFPPLNTHFLGSQGDCMRAFGCAVDGCANMPSLPL